MSRVFVRGGSPGKIRVGLEDSDEFVEVDSGLTVYQGLHELQPWLQALADSVPADISYAKRAELAVALDAPVDTTLTVDRVAPGEFVVTLPKKGKTLPPKGDA